MTAVAELQGTATLDRCEMCRNPIPEPREVCRAMRLAMRENGRVPQTLLLQAFGLCSENCEDRLTLARLAAGARR
jgi:hypothetical protein